ncbi:probable sodium/metabolite cotransporter BASS4, chloroplastic isoform X2 [Oryza brachyantha]|uniref:probable sodium/metabolite cotransporter BASS4, chloroplastic isoform X2 n=1 Tax=Oryza brachyantha TaxID=4533 RepID=UPI001ADBA0F2|nr:probable sodium/metabolite cotransporter BASS4, chloroplastic isoform X2 [Oryza brachyantha]
MLSPAMVTHHLCLLRPTVLSAPFGLRTRVPHPRPPTVVASFHGPTHLRLRPLRAAAGGSSPGGFDGGKRPEAATSSSLGAAVVGFARSNFLPLALITGVALGLVDPTLGCLAHKYSLSKYSTFGIFLISGLTLRTKELGAAVEAWPAGLFGLASILLFTPFLAQFITQIKFFPHEFITGLAMFCCMPTTLSSGVTLTQLVGGNTALALAMTAISNLLGIMIVPLSLAKYIGAGAGVSLPTEQLFKSLVTTLLIPIILGKVARETSKGIAGFVDRNKKGFSVTSAILLSLVPWIQVSRSRSLLLSVQPKAFAVVITVGVKHCQCWLPLLTSLEVLSENLRYWSSHVLLRTLTRLLSTLS